MDDINPYDVTALNAASAALWAARSRSRPHWGSRHGLPRWFMGADADLPADRPVRIPHDRCRQAQRSGRSRHRHGRGRCTENALRLIEAGAAPTDEDAVAGGLEAAKEHIATLIDLQLELATALGEPEPVDWPVVEDYSDELYEAGGGRIPFPARRDRHRVAKHERKAAESAARAATMADLDIDDEHADARMAAKAFGAVARL